MVRLGIIGAGRMGKAHANRTHVIPDLKIAGVYDINPEHAQAMHDSFGAVVYPSADALAASPDVDCVWITSPTYVHLEGLRAAVNARKPVFCEKALCRTPEDAEAMLALGKGYDKLMTFGFVRRHMYKSIKVREIIQSGKLGRIRYANVDLPLGMYKRLPGDWFADFELCGGVIVDMLAHHIDLANWFFGKAKRVYAESLMLSKELPKPSDYVSGTVTYENDVIVNMMCSWWRFGRSNEMMEIYGEHGALSMDNSDIVTLYPEDGEPVEYDILQEVQKLNSGVDNINAGQGFNNQMSKIVDIVSGKAQHEMPTIEDAYASLKVALAMIDSAKSHQAVEL